jgi:hypothetical protein
MKNAAHQRSSFKNEALTGWYIFIPFTSANKPADTGVTSTRSRVVNLDAFCLLVDLLLYRLFHL